MQIYDLLNYINQNEMHKSRQEMMHLNGKSLLSVSLPIGT